MFSRTQVIVYYHSTSGLYIPQMPKQVNLSTEVVQGVVPKWVSKWYMVRVVPKVVPKCGIEIRIPIIIHI